MGINFTVLAQYWGRNKQQFHWDGEQACGATAMGLGFARVRVV